MEWLDDEQIRILIERHLQTPRAIFKDYGDKTPNQYVSSLIDDAQYKRFVKKYCVDTVYKFTTRISFYALERLRITSQQIPDTVFRFRQYNRDPLEIIREMNDIEGMVQLEELRQKISEETGEVIIQNNQILADKYYWFLNDEQMRRVDVEDLMRVINEIYDLNGLNAITQWNVPQDVYTEYNDLKKSYTQAQGSDIVDLTQPNEYIQRIREERGTYLSTIKGEMNEGETNTEKLTIYLNENDYIDIDMSMSAEQFAELLRNAVAQGMREARTEPEAQAEDQFGILEENIPEEEPPMRMEEFQQAMAQSQLGVAQSIHALAQATAMNRVSDYMEKYKYLERDQLIQEYEKFGINYTGNDETNTDLLQKLEFLQALKKQSEVLADIKHNKKQTIDAGFDRITWDIFEKLSTEKLKSGVPVRTEIKYIQGLPNSHIKYHKEDGKFSVHQGTDAQKFNTYKEAKRFAESGAFFSRDLRALRKIHNEFEKQNKPEVFFNARRY